MYNMELIEILDRIQRGYQQVLDMKSAEEFHKAMDDAYRYAYGDFYEEEEE